VRSIAGAAEIDFHGNTVQIVTADAERLIRDLLARDPLLSNLEIRAASLEDALFAIADDHEKAYQKEVAR
jgi:hypothetical protein